MTAEVKPLYSADRRKLYGAGPLVLTRTTYPGFRSFENDGSLLPGELAAHIETLFPDGLSIHGWLYAPFTGSYNGGIHNDAALEITLEYVRRAFFPHLPSRFQSFFAFDDIERVKQFARESAPGSRIVELRSNSSVKVDMGWLKARRQLAGLSYVAHHYWSGAATEMPDWEYLMVPPVDIIETGQTA
jgi:hypothetical protein